jgi:N-acetylglutamate synthase and related acetyltransferases
MGITIREARIEDSNAIATILHSLGWSNHSKSTAVEQAQAEVATWLADFQHAPKFTTVLVAEHSDDQNSSEQSAPSRVIGYVSVHWYPHMMRGGNDGYISELFVHPEARGQGAGTRLLKRVEDLAKQRGCTRLLLLNRRIRESYSRHFYAKHGWKEQGDMAFFSFSLAPVQS